MRMLTVSINTENTHFILALELNLASQACHILLPTSLTSTECICSSKCAVTFSTLLVLTKMVDVDIMLTNRFGTWKKLPWLGKLLGLL